MSTHEQRQYTRIDDEVYFDYKVIDSDNPHSSTDIIDELLGKNGEKYMELTHQFQGIDKELTTLVQALSMKDPILADCINLLNTKIECLAQNTLIDDKLYLRHVDLSLGGIAFKTHQKIKEKTQIKLVIYTRPHMVPIFLDCDVTYSKFVKDKHYRTALNFHTLTPVQEKLLTQHIMQAHTHFSPC